MLLQLPEAEHARHRRASTTERVNTLYQREDQFLNLIVLRTRPALAMFPPRCRQPNPVGPAPKLPASAHISGGDTGKVRISPWPSRDALLRLVANVALLVGFPVVLGVLFGALSGFEVDGRHQPEEAVPFVLFSAYLGFWTLLPGTLIYLALLAGLAEFLTPRRLRAAAIVLSPLVAVIPIAFEVPIGLPYILAFTLAYGALVRLAHNPPPRSLPRCRRARPPRLRRAS